MYKSWEPCFLPYLSKFFPIVSLKIFCRLQCRKSSKNRSIFGKNVHRNKLSNFCPHLWETASNCQNSPTSHFLLISESTSRRIAKVMKNLPRELLQISTDFEHFKTIILLCIFCQVQWQNDFEN